MYNSKKNFMYRALTSDTVLQDLRSRLKAHYRICDDDIEIRVLRNDCVSLRMKDTQIVLYESSVSSEYTDLARLLTIESQDSLQHLYTVYVCNCEDTSEYLTELTENLITHYIENI